MDEGKVAVTSLGEGKSWLLLWGEGKGVIILLYFIGFRSSLPVTVLPHPSV